MSLYQDLYGNDFLKRRGLKMVPEKTEALLVRTGDLSNTRESFSETMMSTGNQALSTWRCSWIVGLALANP